MDRTQIEQLIARVALRDRRAFDDLYDATSSKLFGICLRVLNNRAAAEDAMQDTYVKIWNNADRYAANGLSPMTWLITIARNTAIDRVRARKAGRTDMDSVPGELVAYGPTPEQSAVAASEARKLTDCLDALPTDRGAAIRGAYLDGDSYAELAERFRVPLNTMRTWLRRGLIALRECMSS
ncbi:sigma-70 family RNA polymerase sigma factor [Sulfitobacter sp. D35]|uniref:sigma-70 family RNA polymerase sigma factor n=1 Tax=Sulfitobacter sp. D35 TaxID=3083252 RepID=UPI00296F32C4|nr:sigma-70 family RNA polymerase sigma factor [Sulfitobacter sp. D35]MDW4499535.1 sigma-70 family RNA polymerase sigma factor [Sulfitobacter sp. D35]